MKNELYIDNKAVDIDDNTNITLNFKSNLFTEVSKIVSNNTYSIKLPMTVRNRKVIEHAHLPACSTRFPRINHKGRYLRNGVEIVSDASVTLMEVSDTIDVAMAWGNVSAFAEIVNGDRTLQDLSYGMVENEDYIVWSKELSNSPRLPWLSYGFKNDEPNAWFHPAVSAKWILDKISKDSGVKFVIPESRQGFVERLVIPLLTRNDADRQSESNQVSLQYENWYNVLESEENPYGRSRLLLGFALNEESNYYLKWDYRFISGKNLICKIGSKYKKIDVHVSFDVTLILINSDNNFEDFEFGMYNEYHNRMEQIFTPVRTENLGQDGQGEYRRRVIYRVDDDIVLSDQELLWFEVSTNYTSIRIQVESCNSLSLKPKANQIYVSANRETSEYVNRFYYVPNLPDIKQIDFIKAISSLCGMFAIPDSDGIRFITMDEIVANKSKALNWTKRVVASYPQNRPKLLSFSLDGFAQKNIYKWKDDEEGDNDGIIYVDDKTLDEEEEVITLPFAASEIKSSRTGPYTEIPLYSYNENGELEYNDNLIPRLLVMENQTIATFEGMDWVSIIATQYKTYQEEVREPKVITELIEIPDYELKKLDMSVPIYLGQYGKFYAIISIKAEKTGICECKLFQL